MTEKTTTKQTPKKSSIKKNVNNNNAEQSPSLGADILKENSPKVKKSNSIAQFVAQPTAKAKYFKKSMANTPTPVSSNINISPVKV